MKDVPTSSNFNQTSLDSIKNVAEEKAAHKNPVPVSKKIKKINLSPDQIEAKITDLSGKLTDLLGPQNKKRRANVYQELAK